MNIPPSLPPRPRAASNSSHSQSLHPSLHAQRSTSPIRPPRLQTQSTPNSMRPNPLDLSSNPARLSFTRSTSPLPALATPSQSRNDHLIPIPHQSEVSQPIPLQPPNSTIQSDSELNLASPLISFNPDSPFVVATPSSIPSPLDQNQISHSQHRPSSNQHVPQPLKIIPSSFRRSISAPFTTSGLISLEFPPNARLHSITEDGTSIPSAQPTPTFQLLPSIQPSLPSAGSYHTPTGLSFEASPNSHSFDPSPLLHQSTPHEPQAFPRHSNSNNSTQSDQYRKWASNFYVWVYDPPAPSDPAPPPSPTSTSNSYPTPNLSNQLMGGISKHFFNNSSKSSNLPASKSAASKKDSRVKGLISGLTKQKDTSGLESPTVSVFGVGDKQIPDSSSLSVAEQQLDSFTDTSEVDPTELSKPNHHRFSSTSKGNDLQIKPKRNSTPAETNKIGRKRFVPGFGGGGSGGGGTSSSNGSITSQLALGPGPAMNSYGVGAGQWKLVQGVITEDGHFTLYTTDDTVLYQIYLPSYRRTDIRMVHQSIFGRLHCGVITRRTGNPVHPNNPQNSPPVYNSKTSLPLNSSSSLPLTPAIGSLSSQANGSLTPLSTSIHKIPQSPQNLNGATHNSTASTAANPTTSSNNSSDVSIYVCMPNLVLLESWLVICKCFCRPDDFRHLYPRSNKQKQATNNKGGRNRSFTNNHTHSPLFEQPSCHTLGGGDSGSIRGSIKQGLPERVRIWRGVEIQLLEGKRLGESHQITVNNMVEIGNEAKALMKEERRNSTGGYLPGSSQTSLLSINKELLFNKSSNFAKHQTAQQFIINDPSYQHQDHQPLQYRYKSKNADEINASLPANPNKSSSATSSVLPSLPNEPLGGNAKHRSNSPMNDNFYFVEFDWDREVMGRSTIKRNSNPFWREDFKFSEIGSFKTLMVLNLYQIKKNFHQSSKSSTHSQANQTNSNSSSGYSSKIQLIGQAHLDFKKFEKNLQLQLWLPIYPTNHSSDENSNEYGDENLNSFHTSTNPSIYKKVNIVGEINLSITVFEQVVLAETEYSQMMSMLNNDSDIELPLSLANMTLGELDRLAELLIRIYESSDRLVLRLSQLAAIEINGDVSTASILFRANTLLTKMLEAYMRMVGGSFLELSIGSVIRRICTGKVELEIDPAKLKSSISSSQREKIIHENAKELNKLSHEIWQSMYINRSKCPNRLRKIFVKIQEYVGNAYDDQDMRLTSISAFIFLRFFVPAILNPRLFNLIQFQPDSKSQRTLTLLAKTLQGLGNLTLFGIKEPWMSVMNEFITTQLDSFRDYISFISRESESTKPEWTSKEYEGYGLPYALRASLPASSRDGIPSLPHLLDPVRDCSLLANLMVVVQRKSSGADSLGGNQSSGLLPNRARRKAPVSESFSNLSIDTNQLSSTQEFLAICEELHAKSERRCLKIIQSESKQPTNTKPSSTTNATTTNTPNVNATTTPTTTSLPPTNTNLDTLESLPQQHVINSRQSVVPHHEERLSPPPVLSTTVTLTPPSNVPSSPSSITRWKRSHTVSAEHFSGGSSPVSNSPRSPKVQHSTNTNNSSHLDGGTDSTNFHNSSIMSPFSPSSSALKKGETNGFVLQNRSARSKTLSSPNPFVGSEQRAARQGLFSHFESTSSAAQATPRQEVHNNILNGESVLVSSATTTQDNTPTHHNDTDYSTPPSFINSWEPNKMVYNHNDQDVPEGTSHFAKIRSLSRKSGFKLTGPNHFSTDLQSIPQQHPPEDLEERMENYDNNSEDYGKGYDIFSNKKRSSGKLNDKASKTSFINHGGSFNKERRSSSSLSSLVSASSSSSFASVTHNLRKNLKLHSLHKGLDSKIASPIIAQDRLNYTSPIETSLKQALPSSPSFVPSSPRSSDSQFLSHSQQQPPSSAGSNTITIFQKQPPLSPSRPTKSVKTLRQEFDSHMSISQNNGGISTRHSSCSSSGFTAQNPREDMEVYTKRENCSNNSSSTNSSTSSSSNYTGGIVNSPPTSDMTTATTFSLSSVSSTGIINSHHHAHHHHRKGFIQKIMRKNSVAKS